MSNDNLTKIYIENIDETYKCPHCHAQHKYGGITHYDNGARFTETCHYCFMDFTVNVNVFYV